MHSKYGRITDGIGGRYGATADAPAAQRNLECQMTPAPDRLPPPSFPFFDADLDDDDDTKRSQQ